MPCICKSCVEQSRVLGVGRAFTSKHAIQKAYHAAAKHWHPDRFESDKQKRLEAEEHFKRIQAAYQHLCAHYDRPVLMPRETQFVTPIRRQRIPTISFGDIPGCFVPPNLPAEAERWIAASGLDSTETPVGFVDLFQAGARISRYILLTNHKMYIRDATDILALIWYSDLGEIMLRRVEPAESTAWQRIAQKITGKAQHYSLRIEHSDGKLFRELKEQPDDRLKKVIYNFLLQMKSESQS